MFSKFFKFISVVFLLAIFAFSQNSFAQLTGTKTIPGDYATIALAIADLNTQGVGAGGVTFNVAAGHTETLISETAGTITATGTAGNPIVFQKSGAGANPLITAYAWTAATSYDGMIKIAGGDYITFDGIDLQENAANTTIYTDWGYALVKTSATTPFNGCQYVTIKNCTITLNKTNTSSVGIYTGNHIATATTSLTITDPSDANNNNKFFGNTITNSYAGFSLNGFAASSPYTLYDQNNEVGVTAANTITNFGGGSVSARGIYGIYQNGMKVVNNIINSAVDGSTTTVYGIFLSTGTSSNVDITGNTITLNFTSGSYTSTVNGINNAMGSTAASNTINISNNVVQNCNLSAATSGSFVGILNSASATNVNINGNTISGNTLAGTGTFTGIDGGLATNLNIYQNTVNGNQKTGASGTMYLTRGSTAIVSYYNNNVYDNSFTASSGTSSCIIYGYYNFGSPTVENLYNNNFYNLTVAGSNTGTSSLLNGFHTNTTSSATKSIYGNNIYNFSALSGNVNGIAQYLGTNVLIYKNNIYNLSNATSVTTAATMCGILISSGIVYAYNNFISDLRTPLAASTDAIRAINITSTTATSTIGLYYNSIYLNATSTGTNFGTTGVYHTYSATATTAVLDMRNNVIVNNSIPAGTGLTVAFRRSAATSLVNFGSASNNNDFYAGTPDAAHLIFYDGTNSDQTIDAYKTRVAPRCSAAFSENPPFLNVSTTPYNLHMNTGVATQTESGGTPVTTPVSVGDDYDGNTRNASTPDVGADEFFGIPLDLTPPSISYTTLLNTSSTSNRTLSNVVITDASGVNGTSGTAPRIYFKKSVDANAFVGNTSTDNGWKWTEATGSSPFSFTIDNSIIFGGSVTTGDVVQYFVVAQDNAAPTVGANPSTGFSGTSVSVITSAPTTPNSYIITQAALAGNYTVGLLMFNQVTGLNIYFDKVITKVMKEVDVEVPVELKSVEKGKESLPDAIATSDKPQTIKKLMEVEEISWVPMQNGQPYLGDLFVKKAENPQINYPDNTDGIYTTITAAIADLNLRGVSGATTFLLNDVSYPTETYPFVVNVQNEGNFPTATNTVTIKPNTGVTALIQGASPAGQIFKILNSYVTIDGSNAGGADRSLTIENTSVTSPQVVVIGSTGTTAIINVTLKNCIFINGANTSSAVIVSDGTAPATAGWFNNITIQNNSIQKAYIANYNIAVMSAGNGSGLIITGNDLTTSGANAVRLVGFYVQGVDGATVSNNSVGNIANTVDAGNITGVWFATGTTNSTIFNNTFGPISGTASGPRGIVVTSAVANANVIITGNTVTGMTTTSSGTSTGLYLFSTTSGVTIQKNKVSNIKNTNTGGWGCNGIWLASTLTSSVATVANNFVWDVAAYGYASGAGSGDNGYGIIVTAGAGYNVYSNSVSMNTNQTVAGLPAAFNVNSGVTLAGALDVRNNIFANSQTLGTERYAIYSGAANTVYSDINYNDYYSLGANLGYIGSNRLNLDSLRVGTGKDLQSISGDPYFASASDLHINNAYNTVSNNGQYLAAVTTDIDGDARSVTTPDIGADEYVYVVPSVIDPSGVTATAISSSQIDVAFTPNASSNNVVIVYNLTGTFTTPTGTPVVGGTLADGEVLYINTISPYSHLSLISSTHYYYKLFSYDGSMYSDGVAVDATTLCGVSSAPWTQDFESGVFPPLCWSIAGPASALWNSSTGLAAGISGYGVGTASAWADFWGVSSGSQDLISFDYDVSSLASAQLKFDWAYDIYFSNTDTLKIFYSVDAGTNWVLLATGYNGASGAGLFNLVTVSNGITSEYGGASNPVLATDWATITFALPLGTNKVKFAAASDYGNNLFVDNIIIEAAPAHDIGVTALTRNYGTLIEGLVETGFSREIAKNSVDKNGNQIENVSIRILYPEQKENSPESIVDLLAIVENFGGAVENSYQVGWQIDGTPQTSVSNTQPLEVGDIDTLTLTWATATGGSHSARAWTILGTDANASNDTSGIFSFFICPDNSIYCEQFEQGLIPPTGWVTYNQDGGTETPWFVGNPTVFPAYEGNGYIGNNYQRANGFFIDDWLVTSNTGGIPLELATVDSLVFWMRSPTGSTYPDSVEIRLSTTGQAVGDFTVLLDYFMVPTSGWTRFAYALPTAVNRYIAFRYLMYDGGPAGNSSDYIGLDLVQILRYEVSNTFQLTVSVSDGWNMVSAPGLNSPDQNVSTWWPNRDLGANVFKYLGGYQSVTDAVPGIGYWMKNSGASTYNTGDEWPAGGITIVPHTALTGAAGWNLIGGYEISATAALVTTIPAGQQSGPIYKYSGGYQIATTIDPGYGYWIKLLSAAQIIIPETLAKETKPVEWFPENWGKIVLTDAAGISYTLYSVKGEVNLDNYELPPAPMTGMFDIRFSSGRIAEDINSSVKTIDMSGVTYPVTVRAEGMDMRLMDETGRTVNVNLKSGEDVVISEATIQKLMVTSELLPTVYALEQNYPNPFNPSTVIEFSLPEDVSNVKLSIYNALGEKVAELVNTSLAAGRYSYQWNAKNVATGMYIYELRTDNFVSVKKMLLLK